MMYIYIYIDTHLYISYRHIDCRPCKKLDYSNGIYLYRIFPPDKFVGHLFIQIRKSSFFFPKPKKTKKKNKMCFFLSAEKFIGHSFRF